MSQTGTPTEFLQLGITEPDDTLNVLVDLNGQWRKIDTGVKNVDTKANTNASGISALNTAVQDNTENITNILETNVNQQNSIDTLQSKVAVLESDDTDYGTRITAVEAGVQENSELINDLEVDLSGVKTDMGTVPSGSTLQGQVDGLDTRVTTLENSGSVSALETRVTTLETEVGSVPSGSTVQGQITALDSEVTTLNGQVNSGNIPFRFSVDGGGNYGYLKADDSFVPFSSGSDTHWKLLDKTLYSNNEYSFVTRYKDYFVQDSPNYHKIHDFIHDTDYTLNGTYNIIGCIAYSNGATPQLIKASGLSPINETIVSIIYDRTNGYTYYLTRTTNTFHLHVVDIDGNTVGLPVDFTLRGTPTSSIAFNKDYLHYVYNNTAYVVAFNTTTGTSTESVDTTTGNQKNYINFLRNGVVESIYYYTFATGVYTTYDVVNKVVFKALLNDSFFVNVGNNTYYYVD